MSSFIQTYFGKRAAHTLKRRYPFIAGLHLNEMPRDLPLDLKRRIFERLQEIPLNRYPEPYANSLVEKLASWYGCDPRQLMVGPGSSAFIRLLLTYFGLHMRGRLVITRPSFAYYEQFCLAFGIAYDTWELDDDFQYDLSRLDGLPGYSVVFLTTPNNPTGNLLTISQLELLLDQHQDCLFVVDEAYAEFTDQQMLPLLNRYKNLLLLRTFSKAFSAAGIRCGALIGDRELIEAIEGLQTPWQLSSYTIETAKVMLDYAAETNWVKKWVSDIVAEREQLYMRCYSLSQGKIAVYPSHGNFLLFKAGSDRGHAALLKACDDFRIRIEDISRRPRLERCVRVTIGLPQENQLFLQAFSEAVAKA